MKFSYEWLKECVAYNGPPEALADVLTLAGFEVEGIETIGEDIQGVFTGCIRDIHKHPNADKLVITQIDVGDKSHQIVTGATNIQQGDVVPVSLVGATLAGGMKIKENKLRGVISYGMLCSKVELGVADEAAGIWILPKSTPVGVDFCKIGYLKDTLIDIAILPNRGDCQSIQGLAREIAAITGKKLKTPPLKITKKGKGLPIKIQVKDKELCPYYTAQIIENCQEGETPLWMSRRLEIAGIRPINCRVDITNYVLLEMGQPLHAFDYDKIEGHTLVIRKSTESDTLKTLDGLKRSLNKDTIVICDAHKPLALAGVMGGAESEITEQSQTILLESAWFSPPTIRRTAIYHGLRTESVIRFEKGVDWDGVKQASERAAYLYQTLLGATVSTVIHDDKKPNAPEGNPTTLPLDYKAINQLLGIALTEKQQGSYLTALGYIISKNNTHVTIPSWRQRDVKNWQDLAEDIARLHGYDKIPSTMPSTFIPINSDPDSRKQSLLWQQQLLAKGFYHVINFPMIDPKDCELLGFNVSTLSSLKNPITPKESVMRPIMLPSLLKVYQYNTHRQQEHVQLLETGSVFPKKGTELQVCAGLITGPIIAAPYHDTDRESGAEFFRLKGLCESLLTSVNSEKIESKSFETAYFHPKKAIQFYKGKKIIGECGIIHPKLSKHYDIKEDMAYFSLDINAVVDLPKTQSTFQSLSKFPSTRRDMALLVPKDTTYDEIITCVNKHKSSVCQEVFLFDYFESDSLGKDKKSMAIGCIYQHPEKTLSVDEVNGHHESLCQTLIKKLPVTIR